MYGIDTYNPYYNYIELLSFFQYLLSVLKKRYKNICKRRERPSFYNIIKLSQTVHLFSTKSMAKIVPIVLTLLALSFQVTHAALSCYACNDCGTIWDSSKATIVQTSNANHYCRVSINFDLKSKNNFLFQKYRKQ